MKISITNNLLRVEAETAKESIELYQFATKRHTSAPVKRKKPLHTKVCPECGFKAKGKGGLGIHMRKIHNLPKQIGAYPPVVDLDKPALERLALV